MSATGMGRLIQRRPHTQQAALSAKAMGRRLVMLFPPAKYRVCVDTIALISRQLMRPLSRAARKPP